MTLTTAMFVFECLLAVLLAVTIRYAVSLRRRVDLLRRDGEGIRQAIEAFDAASVRAEASATALRDAGAAATADLAPMLDQARALRDELARLIERGGRGAGRAPAPAAASPAGWGAGLSALLADPESRD